MQTFLHDIIFKDILFFLKGTIVGFAVSIPLGPASVMCIRRTLNRGFFLGLSSGLGVALADTFYGSLAGLGLTSIADLILDWVHKIQLYAGIFLIFIGFYLIGMKANTHSQSENTTGYFKAALSTFGVTLANPFILVLFTAVFAAVGVDNFHQSFHLVGFLILGIFTGSMLWWIVLCGSMSFLHQKIRFQSLSWTNKFSGIVIIIFGLIALVSVF